MHPPHPPPPTSLPQLRLEERLVEWMRAFPEEKRCPFFVHSAFLRYYRAGEPGNTFKLHIDDSMYTIVICFPPWDHKAGEAGVR